MLFGYFTLLVALIIETVGAYYSITGLAAIFSGAVLPILIMGASLEVGKVTAAVWLKMYWERASITYKLYLVPAVAFLMVLTSMGIFGFLSKAHSDQGLVSGDSQAKIAIYDEKIKTAKENIESDRKQLKQMDEAVDQIMGRSTSEEGATKANNIRRAQQRERGALAKDIEAQQKIIIQLNEEAAPLRAENRKIEADVGPIKYIAALIYGDNPDANILERAVRWVIILIVAVFDPLALVLILAAQQTLRWAKDDKEDADVELMHDTVPVTVTPMDNPIAEPAEEKQSNWPITSELWPFPSFNEITPQPKEELVDREDPELKDMPTTEQIVSLKSMGKTDKDSEDIAIEPEVSTQQTEEPKILAMGVDIVERPGDYLTEQEQKENPVVPAKQSTPEAAPGRNRGIMNTHLVAQADNSADNVTGSATGFGTEFPSQPKKGDVYLRVDFLPNRLFKFNGDKWMEIDKAQTDVYAYEEKYIKYLIEQIDQGNYDADTLTDIEREQIAEYLKKNAQ